jgi:hypothetical protein
MKIGKLAVALILVLSIALIVSGVYYWNYLQYYNSMPYKPVPLIDADASPDFFNVSQGATFQVRVTISSISDSQLVIPMEGITLRFRDYTVYDLMPQEEIFTYSFTSNSVTLSPKETKSTVLFVHLTENAPIGDFEITVGFGNADVTYVSGTIFRFTITSP